MPAAAQCTVEALTGADYILTGAGYILTTQGGGGRYLDCEFTSCWLCFLVFQVYNYGRLRCRHWSMGSRLLHGVLHRHCGV